MGDKSIVNLGDVSKPATVLIEKISDAVGGLFLPFQIKRTAKAEAEAQMTRAMADIKIEALQRRALMRFVGEETKKQANMEMITEKAIGGLNEDADPSQIEDDWISNFFEKCRLVSDDEMQTLWARVLAGEANSPGSHSRRTVESLSSLDKADAELFTKLCSFAWLIDDSLIVPLIYGHQDSIYVDNGVTFDSLRHLDDIGLVTFGSVTGFASDHLPHSTTVHYHGQPVTIEFKNPADNQLDLGRVLLSKVGQELARICEAKPVPDFVPHVLEQWVSKGYVLSSPWSPKRPHRSKSE